MSLYYTFFMIFLVVLVIETMVTGAVLLHHQYINEVMSTTMKWWAIISMASISASNILGLLWLKYNHDTIGTIDRGNWVQIIFALSTASLFIWVLVFHRKFLKH